MYPRAVQLEVQSLIRAKVGDYEISRRTGVLRQTVTRWRHAGLPKGRRAADEVDPDWSPPHHAAYSYLLGLYLGDGYLWTHRRAVALHLYLDSGYPAVIAEASDAIQRTIPGIRISRYLRSGSRCMRLQAAGRLWLVAFPQHGHGKKHERAIRLEEWQLAITRKYPKALIRGLIHSDGCRCINRFKTKLPSGRVAEYEYVRYFFSNLSEDIKDIFCRHADLLGIRWSRANPRYVSIHDRQSVGILDSFVGPKA